MIDVGESGLAPEAYAYAIPHDVPLYRLVLSHKLQGYFLTLTPNDFFKARMCIQGNYDLILKHYCDQSGTRDISITVRTHVNIGLSIPNLRLNAKIPLPEKTEKKWQNKKK